MTSIAAYFARSSAQHGDRPALVADGRTLTYRQLEGAAASIASALNAAGAGGRVGVLAQRTWATYAAVLGILYAGRTYVPLNPKFPQERNDMIADLAELEVVAVDGGMSSPSLRGRGGATMRQLPIRWPATDAGPLPHAGDVLECDIDLDEQGAIAPEGESLAYLLFTSGTTGIPKGVPITHDNVRAYVDHLRTRCDLGPADRCSQTFDLTFDLSVHDMFLTWSAGACLHVLPDRALMAPAKYIREHGLTAWFSVPSTIGFMQKLRMLKPGSFPTLRYSWFCGEGLPASSARAWQSAAPDSVVENLYGPTEATIAFTAYRWRGDESEDQLPEGLVPIGRPFPGLETLLIDSEGVPVPAGGQGELCLGGPQLSPGYWRDPQKTAAAFIHLAHPSKRETRWYRTGDLASEDAEGVLRFHGRLDSQVKILGHRVELGEVENALRQSAETDLVAAIAWPLTEGSAGGIAAFVCGTGHSAEEIRDRCAERLPAYMVPHVVHLLTVLPTNANGKIDRGQLRQLLEKASHD